MANNFTMENNEKKIRRAIKALKKNNIDGYFAANHQETLDIVKSIVPQGSSVSCGGSVTLSECGVAHLMTSGFYDFLDRSRDGISPDEIREIYIKTHGCDAFFTSANAITENGELYNVDGNGNRISAIIHGPGKVVVIAGVNKIVKDMPAAVYRVKTVAAPCNAARLHTDTPCMINGKCIAADGEMTDGCSCEKRMCVHYLVSAYQRVKGRISVIFLNEELGY